MTTYYTIAGKPSLKIYAEGLLFNHSVPLAEALQRYQPEGFIGDFCFPVISVGEQIGMVPLFGAGDARVVPVERAPGVEGNIAQFNVGSVQAYARSRSLRYPVSVELELNTPNAWRLRESVALYLRGLLLLAKENRVASIVGSPANVGSIFLPSSSWASGGNAFGNVESVISAVSSASGMRPDRIGFGCEAWTAFAANTTTIGRCGGWTTVGRVAEALRVSSIGIGEARHNVGAGTDRKYVPTFPADRVVIFKGGGAEGTFGPRWGISANWKPAALDAAGRFIVELGPVSRRNLSSMCEVHHWESEVICDPSLAAIIAGTGSSQSGGI